MRTVIRFLIFFSALFPLFVSAATAQFIFTTDPQTLAQGELSQSITVQSQDAEGKATTTVETIDLAFLGTSATGEFLNASGNSVSTVMNKGTTNRTFYYRDQSSGHYTLTVKATGRVSGQVWNSTQNISITGGAGTPLASTSTPPSSSPEVSSSPLAPATGGGGSSLLPPQISVQSKVPVRAVAGADIVFEASAAGLKKEPLPNARFVWSFGDGATAEGKKVLHAYHLPASYVVLVEASSGEWSATDRADITVVTPQILLSRIQTGADGFIEVKNNGGDDLDLARWFLRSGSAFFSFPNGTILKKGNAVPFSSVVTKLFVDANDVALLYPNGTEAVHYSPPFVSSPIAKEKAEAKEIIKVEPREEIKVEPRGEVQPLEEPPSPTEIVASVAAGGESTGGNTFLWVGLAVGLAVLGAGGYLWSVRQRPTLSEAAGYEITE